MSGAKTFFAFRMSSSSTNMAISICDPCNVLMQDSHYPGYEADGSEMTTYDGGTLTLVLDALTYSIEKSDTSSRPGPDDCERRVQLYKLSVLNGDFSVSQSLIASTSSSVSFPIRKPDKSKIRSVPGPIMEDSTDGFIVSYDESDTPWQENAESPKITQLSFERESHTGLVREDPWTLSTEWVQLGIQSYLENQTIPFSETLASVRRDIEQDSGKELVLPKSL